MPNDAGLAVNRRSKVLINKASGFEHLDALIAVDIQKVFISAADDLCAGGQIAVYKFIIIRIVTDRFIK